MQWSATARWVDQHCLAIIPFDSVLALEPAPFSMMRSVLESEWSQGSEDKIVIHSTQLSERISSL
jgi:hypothetical protein